MRILVVNDGVGDAGGVQNYLAAVGGALRTRGHDLALLHMDPLRTVADSPLGGDAPHFCITTSGAATAIAAALGWNPDLVFSHNMRDLNTESALAMQRPVVKMMHGYFGTCIGGHKMHAFPRAVACDRRFGAACAALYLPRRCGRLSVGVLTRDYAWAQHQHDLLSRYASVVVASDHMRDEYVRHGVSSDRVVANPLFAADVPARPAAAPDAFHIAFLGRMTALKGGDALIRAASIASRELDTRISLTLAGDGPSRASWESLARALDVNATFPGWIGPGPRAALYDTASVVAVPSIWPEPFGLTGLEGGAHGAAAIAFDVGGIRTWLNDGNNGWMVPPNAGARGFARAIVEAATNTAELQKRRAGARRMAETLTLSRHVDVLEATFKARPSRGAA